MSDKVLFLDVDGVLNTTATWDCIQEQNYVYRLSRELVDNLKQIRKDTDCKIVLSSTWRKREHAMQLLESNIGPISSVTPIKKGPRGNEIKAWLELTNFSGNYAILDDNGDMLLEQLPYFIQTDPEFGLTNTLVHRVICLLNNGTRYVKT
jgi:hypothetical protein